MLTNALNTVGQYGMAGLGALGNVVDLPGSAARDLLAGKGLAGSFDQFATPFSDGNRTSGRELLRHYGIAGDDDNWGNFAGGMAVEAVTDPLNLVGGGWLKQAAKARATAMNANRGIDAANATSMSQRAAGFMPEEVVQNLHPSVLESPGVPKAFHAMTPIDSSRPLPLGESSYTWFHPRQQDAVNSFRSAAMRDHVDAREMMGDRFRGAFPEKKLEELDGAITRTNLKAFDNNGFFEYDPHLEQQYELAKRVRGVESRLGETSWKDSLSDKLGENENYLNELSDALREIGVNTTGIQRNLPTLPWNVEPLAAKPYYVSSQNPINNQELHRLKRVVDPQYKLSEQDAEAALELAMKSKGDAVLGPGWSGQLPIRPHSWNQVYQPHIAPALQQLQNVPRQATRTAAALAGHNALRTLRRRDER